MSNTDHGMRAFFGEVFDGHTLRTGALLVADGICRGIVDRVPDGIIAEPVSGVMLPGFVDVQVNGGGGVLFNDVTSVDGLRRMAQAHRGLGCAGILPTLITDTPAKVTGAIAAVRDAVAQAVDGVLGLHLEGPHLDPRRKGAHDAALIRPMTRDDCAELEQAAAVLPNLMVTVAPESVSLPQITRLTAAGVIVSLGHTDCGYDQACAAFDAGARCVTHLFNAMSQMGHRAPGLVGAALDRDVAAGLIADGEHVHPVAMRAALAAKTAGEVFLVSDAMAVAGTDLPGFDLMGRRVLRNKGRLTLEDGTLAGADLSLARAVQVLCDSGVPRAQALRRATSAPASILRDARGCGRFVEGAPCRVLRMSGEAVEWLT